MYLVWLAGLTAQAHCWENQHFRNRWRTLLSVDDLVSAVLDSLETAQIMNQTFVVYSSDHGYKQVIRVMHAIRSCLKLSHLRAVAG